ncbi:MAG: hypothetical protein V1792_26580 [Pseudomonadota bacterium]
MIRRRFRPLGAFVSGLACAIWAISASLSFPSDAFAGDGAPRLNPYPVWWGTAPEITKGIPCKNPGHCVDCHEENASMDAPHALPCIKCHGGNPEVEDEEAAHKGLIKDPGDLLVSERTCGTCHPEEVRRVNSSSMALAPRMINHTRFAFGAQKSPEIAYAVTETGKLKQVPSPSISKNLGDDLLRRSCLRCHLHTSGSQRWGEHRGKGCSACHTAYPNSRDGRPRQHAIVRSTGVTACLKCHNANHVGADYVGLYEKDFQRGFHSPFVRGRQAPTIYGAEHHRLSADVHFRAGMMCADCHTLDEIHGTGKLPASPSNGVKISCEGCHVRGDHPGILKMPDGQMTLLRGKGRTVPRWNSESIPHGVDAHRKRLRCSACHAAWGFQDYGFHLMLEERPDYWKWAATAMQNDPQVQDLLRTFVGTEADFLPPAEGPVRPLPEEDWKPPTMRDWLTGEVRKGSWFRGHTMRRWERPPLGRDGKGKISVMRPMYQYVISHVDGDANLLIDREVPSTGAGFPALIVNPYTPHTTASQGRTCQECHGSPKAVGLGEGLGTAKEPLSLPLLRRENRIPGHSFRWDALVDNDGNALQYGSRPLAGPLDRETVRRLLRPSDRHRAMWYNYLKEKAKPNLEQ